MIRLIGYFFITLLLTSILVSSENNGASKDELYTGKEYKNAFANPKDDPKLPNVLLIGDSISIGYTTEVRKQLKGKADVFRIPTNGRYAAYGLRNLKQWLGERKYDVIHFNWGLWDICYRSPKSKNQGRRDKVNGTITATPKAYKETMEKIVKELQKSGAKLIWCSTTPVPNHELGRIKGDEVKYNLIATEIMKKNGIHINDLHTHAMKKIAAIQKDKGDVHYNKQGYIYLAEKVAKEILQFLK